MSGIIGYHFLFMDIRESDFYIDHTAGTGVDALLDSFFSLTPGN